MSVIARGVMAQLVARLNGIQKVRGSNPLSSTIDENPLAQPSGFLFVVEHVYEQKFLTKIFVRGLLRSNDPKVVVMSVLSPLPVLPVVLPPLPLLPVLLPPLQVLPVLLPPLPFVSPQAVSVNADAIATISANITIKSFFFISVSTFGEFFVCCWQWARLPNILRHSGGGSKRRRLLVRFII